MKEARKEPGHGDAVERTITEAELAAAVFNRAVKKIDIASNFRGHFELTVTLIKKEGEHQLITTRNTVKEWVSLDRLYKHLRDDMGLDQYLNFSFTFSNNTSKQS